MHKCGKMEAEQEGKTMKTEFFEFTGCNAFRVFPNARHDLLHEERNGAETVRHCIADWLA